MLSITEHVLPVRESLESFYESRYAVFFLRVASFISKRGGTLEDAKDIYHDALIFYYERMMKPDFVLQTNEDGYIMGIVKNLWSSKIKHELTKKSFVEESESQQKQNEIDTRRLHTLVSTAGKKCLDLLSAFYNQSTLKNIALRFGFQSEHSAAVQKYKCLEKIRETIKQKSLRYEDFFE